MIHFEPILEDDFTDYWNDSVHRWIKNAKRAGLMDSGLSFEEADAQVRKFIPEGLKSPGHYFLYIVEGNQKVGDIWIEIRNRAEISAFLWNITIGENYRGKGYGKEAMKLMETFAGEKGAVKISLNVFGYNDIARNLYRKTGYREAAITMVKDL